MEKEGEKREKEKEGEKREKEEGGRRRGGEGEGGRKEREGRRREKEGRRRRRREKRERRKKKKKGETTCLAVGMCVMGWSKEMACLFLSFLMMADDQITKVRDSNLNFTLLSGSNKTLSATHRIVFSGYFLFWAGARASEPRKDYW